MILFSIKKLNKEKNITLLFLILLFVLLVLDHIKSKNNLNIQFNNNDQSEHQDGESPCGM